MLLVTFFFTTPMNIPSVKSPLNCWSSRQPGSWNVMEKSPGGQRFRVSLPGVKSNDNKLLRNDHLLIEMQCCFL